jgi:hypothetical protein
MSSLDGNIVGCKEPGGRFNRDADSGPLTPPKVQTPPNRSPGAFPPLYQPAQFRTELCRVLGGHPLVPMLLHRILFIRRPQVSPESHRLWFGSSAPDDDPQRLSLDNEWTTGHGVLLHEGKLRASPKVHRSCRLARHCISKPALYLEWHDGNCACRSDAGGDLTVCPQDTAACRE